ncbi:MAG: hypothetical protein AAB382_02555 [Chloroflexota bacterium]
MSDSESRSTPRKRTSRTWRAIRLFTIGGTAIAVAVAILSVPIGAPADSLTLTVGDVTTADIIAPRSVTYISQVQTGAARGAAASAVPDV